MSEEFSVVLYFPTGDYLYERRNLDAETAVRLAKKCTQRPAAFAGLVPRIIITDGEDNTVFEWKHGEGVTFPPPF